MRFTEVLKEELKDKENKKIYNKMTHKFHPDKKGGDKETMSKINVAVLSGDEAFNKIAIDLGYKNASSKKRSEETPNREPIRKTPNKEPIRKSSKPAYGAQNFNPNNTKASVWKERAKAKLRKKQASKVRSYATPSEREQRRNMKRNK